MNDLLAMRRDPLTGLWLPQSYWIDQELRRRSGVRIMLGWSDIMGDHLPDERLIELVASMRTETMLITLSMISILSTDDPPQIEKIHEQHCQWARELCTPAQALRVERLITSGRGDMIIRPEQLLIAAKLAFLYGQTGPAEAVPLDAIGELLLGINDLFSSEHQVNTLQELLIPLLSRTQSAALGGQPRYQLPRYFDLLVTRSRKKAQCDLDTAFLRQTGIPLEEYMAFALFYLEPFTGASRIADLRQKNFLHRLRLNETQVRDPHFLQRCQQLFARDTEAFRTLWSSIGDHPLRGWNFQLFQQYPLFRMSNGSAIPISLPFLLDKMSLGAYWLLHESFRTADSEHGVQTFTAHIGKLFEEYITDLLLRTYSAGGPERFFDEQSILRASPHMQQARRRGKQPKCCDGVLVSGTSLVLFEMTATTLPAQTLMEGDPVTFESGLHYKFAKKIDQLTQTFDGLAQYRLNLPELDRSSITHVYPVLVLLYPFPQHLATWELAYELAQPSGWYRFGETDAQTYVHAPQILTAEELEILEPLLRAKSFSLPDLLAQKMERKETATMSMKSYLLDWRQMEQQPNEYMLNLFEHTFHVLEGVLKRMINLVER